MSFFHCRHLTLPAMVKEQSVQRNMDLSSTKLSGLMASIALVDLKADIKRAEQSATQHELEKRTSKKTTCFRQQSQKPK